MKPEYRSRRFSAELRHPERGQGAVTILQNENDETDRSRRRDTGEEDPDGLVIYTSSGYGRRPQGKSYVIHFAKEHEELSVMAFRCGFGYMPPEIFADWLQDREEELYPLLHQWPNEDARAHWNGVLSELRRIGGVT